MEVLPRPPRLPIHQRNWPPMPPSRPCCRAAASRASSSRSKPISEGSNSNRVPWTSNTMGVPANSASRSWRARRAWVSDSPPSSTPPTATPPSTSSALLTRSRANTTEAQATRAMGAAAAMMPMRLARDRVLPTGSVSRRDPEFSEASPYLRPGGIPSARAARAAAGLPRRGTGGRRRPLRVHLRDLPAMPGAGPRPAARASTARSRGPPSRGAWRTASSPATSLRARSPRPASPSPAARRSARR